MASAEPNLDEVDGVRVLWQDLPGPFQARLLFGVGQAHERLPVHGITHLVEHLVLTGSSQAPHAYNGMTGTVTTAFVAVGESGDVVQHLATVCAHLRQLPVARLEHECQVLRAEAAQRAGNPADPLVLWRWGPLGFGLTAYEEMVLRWVTPEQAVDWTSRFARDNAVLWLSKPPTPDLRLELPHTATPVVAPPVHVPASPLPGSFPLNGRGVSFSLLGHRGPQAASAMWLLQHRLEQRLRHELGLVYSVSGGADVLDADTRHFMFRLDCLEESSAAVQAEVAKVLLELPSPVSPQEWEKLVAQRSLGMQGPEELRALQYLDNAAESLLMGRDVRPRADWEAAVEAVSAEEVTGYLAEVLPSLVIGVADPAQLPQELATPLPLFSTRRVDGAVLKPSAAHPDPRVRSAIVGSEGASIVMDGGDTVSVETANLAGALCFDDGTRHLLGLDGFHVKLAPEEWVGAQSALSQLDRALDASVRIPAGPRNGSAGVAAAVTAAPQPALSASEGGWPRQDYVLLAWALVPLVGGLAALAAGNTDAGTFYPVVGALLLARLSWRRHSRRRVGGS